MSSERRLKPNPGPLRTISAEHRHATEADVMNMGRCQAITRRGWRCSRNAWGGLTVCPQHATQALREEQSTGWACGGST